MTGIATVFGGSGFVGRYVAQRLARSGWRVRAAVRRPNEAIFVRTYGVPGQVEPVLANVRFPATVAAAIRNSDAVVNCVGILSECKKQRYRSLHVEGAAAVAAAAAREGVGKLVHISSIGISPDSASGYSRTKALGEQAVTSEFESAVIMRPSVIFGPEDQFFNKFAGMARWLPIVPIVGASTRFQPVYVDDVSRAICHAVEDHSVSGAYELGGPDVLTFRELMEKMLLVIRRRRMVVDLPVPIAAIAAFKFEAFQVLSGGLFANNMLTRDQIRQLKVDNVVGQSARTFSDLGIVPSSMDLVLSDYLYRFRPAGQYTSIHESAMPGARGEDLT